MYFLLHQTFASRFSSMFGTGIVYIHVYVLEVFLPASLGALLPPVDQSGVTCVHPCAQEQTKKGAHV